ncbi:MAG: fumarylacetoacetate hydrolase family protein [Chromatiales bacterium]|nr:fumarylacetoacetate hydrolase family protein [Chromatiales bacterium]
MKLAYFDDFRLGVVKDDRVIDVTTLLDDIPHRDSRDLMAGLIEDFDEFRAALHDAANHAQGLPLASVRLRPPVPRPANIVCMAVNYMEDGTRDEPAPINAFQKTEGALIGRGDTMQLPDMPAAIFEGEAEMAVVIGRRAQSVPEDRAMEHVFGYMNFIDGSARGVPAFYQMKARETFAPTGPYLVTADEIANPQALQVKLWNNGELRQNFNTDDMAHNIAKCISWVSGIHTLEPGDILATGTNHRGLHAFMDGAKIELETEGLGRLSFVVGDPLKRTWPGHSRLDHETMGLEGRFAAQSGGKYAQ